MSRTIIGLALDAPGLSPDEPDPSDMALIDSLSTPARRYYVERATGRCHGDLISNREFAALVVAMVHEVRGTQR